MLNISNKIENKLEKKLDLFIYFKTPTNDLLFLKIQKHKFNSNSLNNIKFDDLLNNSEKKNRFFEINSYII